MSRVYIPQRPMRYCQVEKKLVDRYPNLPLVSEYGEMSFVLPADAKSNDLPSALKLIRQKMVDYSDDDFLVMTGNPLFMGACVKYAAEANDGFVQFLTWSNKDSRYMPVRARL